MDGDDSKIILKYHDGTYKMFLNIELHLYKVGQFLDGIM